MSWKDEEIYKLKRENEQIKELLSYTIELTDKEYYFRSIQDCYGLDYNRCKIIYKYNGEILTKVVNVRKDDVEMFYWGKDSYVIKVKRIGIGNDRLYAISKQKDSTVVDVTEFATHMAEKTCVVDK